MQFQKVYDRDFVNPLVEDDRHFIAVWLVEADDTKAYILQEDSHLKEFEETTLCELKATINMLSSRYALWGYKSETLKDEL